MNIAIFTDCYLPIKNGVVTSIAQLKEGLEQKGHRVIVFTVAARGHTERDPSIIRFPSLPIGLGTELAFGLVNQSRINQFMRSENIQLVHSHTEFSLCISATMAARKFKVPRVQTTHTMWEEYRHYILNGWLLSGPMVRFFLRRQFQGCAGLVAPSQKAAKYYGEILPEIPLKIIPNGLDCSKFSLSVDHAQESRRVRSNLGLDAKDKVILFVGRIGREKRVLELFESMLPVLRKAPKSRLVMVGDGPELNRIRRWRDELGLGKQVVLPGYVEWEEIRGIYHCADLFVTASMSEVHPMTIIEAMMCSLPIVARRDDSYCDSVQNGINGYLADSDAELGHHVSDLLQCDEKSKHFGMASRSIVDAYSGQLHAERMAEFYEQILNRFHNNQPPEQYRSPHGQGLLRRLR